MYILFIFFVIGQTWCLLRQTKVGLGERGWHDGGGGGGAGRFLHTGRCLLMKTGPEEQWEADRGIQFPLLHPPPVWYSWIQQRRTSGKRKERLFLWGVFWSVWGWLRSRAHCGTAAAHPFIRRHTAHLRVCWSQICTNNVQCLCGLMQILFKR